MVVSHSASTSSVETKVVAVTSPRRRSRPAGETTTTTEEAVTDMSYRWENIILSTVMTLFMVVMILTWLC